MTYKSRSILAIVAALVSVLLAVPVHAADLDPMAPYAGCVTYIDHASACGTVIPINGSDDPISPTWDMVVIDTRQPYCVSDRGGYCNPFGSQVRVADDGTPYIANCPSGLEDVACYNAVVHPKHSASDAWRLTMRHVKTIIHKR